MLLVYKYLQCPLPSASPSAPTLLLQLSVFRKRSGANKTIKIEYLGQSHTSISLPREHGGLVAQLLIIVVQLFNVNLITANM